jgi:DNA-binding NarL/FixJ family response regulator
MGVIVKDEVSVLIVEDEPAFLLRFVEAVLTDSSLSLAGAVSTGRAALALLDSVAPDVMLVDLGLPDMDGVEVIRHAARQSPEMSILVATMLADDQHVLACIEAGASGYLLKDELPESISASLHEIHQGGAPISPSIARRVLNRFRQMPSPAALPFARGSSGHANGNGQGEPGGALSQREIDILRLVAKGMSFAQVGELLAISPHTVVTHIKKIYRKLAVHSRGEAVYEARQMGLL